MIEFCGIEGGGMDVANEERPKRGKRVSERALQCWLPPEKRKGLTRVSLDLGDDVERERVLKPGPMIGYIARWFLTLPRARQLEIVLAGRKIEINEPKPGQPPSGPPPVSGNPDGRIKGRGGRKLPKCKGTNLESVGVHNDRPAGLKRLGK